jgi:hypothetical protein
MDKYVCLDCGAMVEENRVRWHMEDHHSYFFIHEGRKGEMTDAEIIVRWFKLFDEDSVKGMAAIWKNTELTEAEKIDKSIALLKENFGFKKKDISQYVDVWEIPDKDAT